MSAYLNTLSGTLYEDFYLRYISKNSSPTKASFIMKVITVCVGCLCVILVYLVEHLKGILQACSRDINNLIVFSDSKPQSSLMK